MNHTWHSTWLCPSLLSESRALSVQMIFLQHLQQVWVQTVCMIARVWHIYIGSAISWDGHFNVQTEDDTFSSVIDYVLNCGCFIYIGAWLPFDAYKSPEYGITPWKLVLLVIAILVLRRIPPLLALYRFVPEIASWKEALFSGHFGKWFSSCYRFYLNTVYRSSKSIEYHPSSFTNAS